MNPPPQIQTKVLNSRKSRRKCLALYFRIETSSLVYHTMRIYKYPPIVKNLRYRKKGGLNARLATPSNLCQKVVNAVFLKSKQ